MTDSFLTRLATSALGSERARTLPSPGISEQAWQLARYALKKAKLSDPVVFFFDDIVVMHYGSTVAASHSTVRCRSTGAHLNGVNEIVSTTATLSAECLRRMFAVIELLVFKLIHIQHEGQRTDYEPRSEGHRKRLRRLHDLGTFDASIHALLEQLYATRCEFAHTVQDLDALTYCGQPLSRSFRYRAASYDEAVRQFLLEDMFTASEALLLIFRPLQSRQLDADKFENAWLALAPSKAN